MDFAQEEGSRANELEVKEVGGSGEGRDFLISIRFV